MWVKTRDAYHNLTMCRSIRYGVTHVPDPTHEPGTPSKDLSTGFVNLYYGTQRDGQNAYTDSVTVVQIPPCEDAANKLTIELRKLDAVLRGESHLWDATEVSPLPNKKPHY
jgi:hypothetical protein